MNPKEFDGVAALADELKKSIDSLQQTLKEINIKLNSERGLLK